MDGPSGRRHRTLALAIAAIVVGVGVAAAGAAIAGPWLDARGLGAVAAVGLVALLGGLAALVVGVRLAWHSTKGLGRAGAMVGVLVAVVVVGRPVAIAVAATNVPRRDLGTATPADRGLTYEDVTFTTSDGVELSGWYVPSRNGAAVIVLHGASSTRSSVLAQAEVLADHGYGVLLFDARGTGRSEGRAMNLGWYGDQDLGAAVDHLEGRAGVDDDRIGALGESMGGEVALGALASEERLRAVVAEGATNRVGADRDWLVDAYGARGQIQRALDVPTFVLTDLLTGADPPVPLADAVGEAQHPVLLITAGEVPDEGHAARSIAAASADLVEVWTVPGADHTGGLRTDPSAWTERVVAFFDRTLAPSG